MPAVSIRAYLVPRRGWGTDRKRTHQGRAHSASWSALFRSRRRASRRATRTSADPQARGDLPTRGRAVRQKVHDHCGRPGRWRDRQVPTRPAQGPARTPVARCSALADARRTMTPAGSHRSAPSFVSDAMLPFCRPAAKTLRHVYPRTAACDSEDGGASTNRAPAQTRGGTPSMNALVMLIPAGPGITFLVSAEEAPPTWWVYRVSVFVATAIAGSLS